jgi:DNA-directed RNA polymerase alpha subunit
MKPTKGLPAAIGSVAPRGLAAQGIRTLEQVAKHSEEELLQFHGVGPKAVRTIKEELAKLKLHLKKSS